MRAKWAELALFWAWMGYPSKALRVLNRLVEADGVVPGRDPIRKLVTHRADYNDVAVLRNILHGPYEECILKSLWIDELYLKRMRISGSDAEWFADFPPDTNTFHFLRYAIMLGWLYKRSGYPDEASLLADRINNLFGNERGVRSWALAINRKSSFADIGPRIRTRFEYDLKNIFKHIASRYGL